ncbi:hypothetical protein DNI29_19375 [Hymenobacter sediminis]|uniref:hypothetical protein n=1 Tax=Hymenobacter sediminis TaxID=2218621 RepID=UPI000DA67194|nr:hypothetical protein [Hymenobacter sediminis]RPD44866.1 hypothetical protein DNI29_19375 [Hymenobacter sediminis]
MTSINRFLILGTLLALPLLPACQSDAGLVICEDGSTPNPNPGAPTTIKDVLTQLGAPTQTFTYDPSRQNQFTGAKGTVITIPAGAFQYRTGQPVTVPVQLEVREIFGKADMILSNMPTVSGGRLLESAGEIYLRPTQDSTLRLSPGTRIQMQTQNPPNLASRDSMRLFVAPVPGSNSPTCFTWELNFDPESSLSPTPTGYQISISKALYDARIGWFNCDRFYGIPSPQPIIVDVPGTDIDPAKNTMVFAAFRAFNGSLRLCDFKAPGTFQINGAPAGANVSVVVIRTVEGKLYYGRQDGVVAAGTRFSPVLKETTAADLVADLNTL